jgi:xanthine/uracil permease
MQIVDRRRHLMKRIAVVIGIVIGIAATPAVVTADSSDESKSDRYELARMWKTQHGELYGPVEVAPATYGFYSK